MIFFSPSGRLEWVSSPTGALVRPTDAVHLLLGRRDLMFDVTARGTPMVDPTLGNVTVGNSSDIVFQNLSPIPSTTAATVSPPAESFWITVGNQTGLVVVSQVAPNIQDYTGVTVGQTGGLQSSDKMDKLIKLSLDGSSTYTGARSFTRDNQSVGGR